MYIQCSTINFIFTYMIVVYKAFEFSVWHFLHIFCRCFTKLIQGCFVWNVGRQMYCFPKSFKSLNLDRVKAHERLKLVPMNPRIRYNWSFTKVIFNVPSLIFWIVCVCNLNSNGINVPLGRSGQPCKLITIQKEVLVVVLIIVSAR